MEKFVTYDSPYGLLRIVYDGERIIGIRQNGEEDVEGAKSSALTDIVVSQLKEYFVGTRQFFDFPYEMRGTAFQLKVWDALCRIPYGETRTYKEIAIEVGSPKASRAVGMANNRNPIFIVVPCHRVVGANGSLVGYAGGVEMKESLLELERVVCCGLK